MRLIIQIILFSSTFLLAQSNQDIYLIKTNLHVGITFIADSTNIKLFPFLSYEDIGNITDIGWGDADFYQDPDPSIFQGAMAVLWPTSSVVRVVSYSGDVNTAIRFCDYCVKISLSPIELKKMAEYINDSFLFCENGNLIRLNDKTNMVAFYESSLSYHLYHTCNTWIAETLEHSGLPIEADGIVTASGLFSEIKNLGTVLKSEE